MLPLKDVKGILLSFVVALPVVGCAVQPHSEQLIYAPLNEKATKTVVDHRATYVREVTPIESFQSERINFIGQAAIVDIFRKQLPLVNIVPADTNVDLAKKVSVRAKDMPAVQFLDYLSATTGYDFTFEDDSVVVRSFVTKQWNLSVFSAKRNVNLQVGKSFSSAAGGGANRFNGTFSDDEWTTILEGAQRILGVSGVAKKGEMNPYLQAVRSIGTISAGGEPRKIQAVDEFINSIVKSGSKQINISVQAYEVTLDDKRAAGIDWQQLAGFGSLNGNDITMGFATSDGAEGVSSIFENLITYEGSDLKASALFQFLSTFGEVELLNQPNVTVRNGTYAYISAGEELTYVGEIEVEDEDNSSDDKITAKIESIRVGVTLSVAPRILDDGRILLEIWPSISSADLTKEVSFGAGEFVLPKIQLQELATEVITESGRPVQLGGFIRRSIAKSLSELPWQERITGKILNPIFKSETAELERTELVLTVTPTVVEGV